jgi:ribonuclease HI
MTQISVFTDGACSGNPGPGGWAAILSAEIKGKPYTRELSGGEAQTTNNRMEYRAVLEALRAVKMDGCQVIINTDSQLIVGQLAQGWKVKDAEMRKFVSEIREVVASKAIDLVVVKVKGHDGDALNERADELARMAIPQ